SRARQVPQTPPAHANGTSGRTRRAALSTVSFALLGLCTVPLVPSRRKSIVTVGSPRVRATGRGRVRGSPGSPVVKSSNRTARGSTPYSLRRSRHSCTRSNGPHSTHSSTWLVGSSEVKMVRSFPSSRRPDMIGAVRCSRESTWWRANRWGNLSLRSESSSRNITSREARLENSRSNRALVLLRSTSWARVMIGASTATREIGGEGALRRHHLNPVTGAERVVRPRGEHPTEIALDRHRDAPVAGRAADGVGAAHRSPRHLGAQGEVLPGDVLVGAAQMV